MKRLILILSIALFGCSDTRTGDSPAKPRKFTCYSGDTPILSGEYHDITYWDAGSITFYTKDKSYKVVNSPCVVERD